MDAAKRLWNSSTLGCEINWIWSAQYQFYPGVLLSKIWNLEVNLSPLRATTAPIDPDLALGAFKRAIKAQCKQFDERLWKAIYGITG